jgi:hypothetical protein
MQSPIAVNSLDRSINGFSTGGLRDLINGRVRAERERNGDYEEEE